MIVASEPLADVKRRAAVDYVLPKVRRYVVEHGADATMDQLAGASGVSRRTLFRLFDTRERLIVEAFAVGMDSYFDNLPRYDRRGDVEEWLRATCVSAHQSSAVYGPGYWELTSRPDLPPDLAMLERRRLDLRRAAMGEIAQTLWTALGADREPPDLVVAVVGAHLSPHFTAAVMTDVGGTWEIAAELAHNAILGVVREQVATDRSTRGGQRSPS